MKLTYEDKLDIFNKRKEGITYKSLSIKYGVLEVHIRYLFRLGKYHGTDIFKKTKNRKHSSEYKLYLINKVLLDGKSLRDVSIEAGLSSPGILVNWIKNYKENRYNVVNRPRGRPTTMKPNKEKDNKALTAEERIKELEEKLKYAEMENEFLKKLAALVQKDKLRK